MEYIIRELEKFYYLYEELIIKDRAYYLAIIIDDNKIIMNIVKSGEIEEMKRRMKMMKARIEGNLDK